MADAVLSVPVALCWEVPSLDPQGAEPRCQALSCLFHPSCTVQTVPFSSGVSWCGCLGGVPAWVAWATFWSGWCFLVSRGLESIWGQSPWELTPAGPVQQPTMCG